MTSAPQVVIDELLPFSVLDVEWTDPTLRLMGSDWALNITCPWKFERAGVVEYDWTWAAVEDRVWDLVGNNIVAVLFDEGGPCHQCWAPPVKWFSAMRRPANTF